LAKSAENGNIVWPEVQRRRESQFGTFPRLNEMAFSAKCLLVGLLRLQTRGQNWLFPQRNSG
jgi:hypothetical protein